MTRRARRLKAATVTRNAGGENRARPMPALSDRVPARAFAGRVGSQPAARVQDRVVVGASGHPTVDAEGPEPD